MTDQTNWLKELRPVSPEEGRAVQEALTPAADDAYTRERDAIAARPCQCVSCPDCNGRGFIGRCDWDTIGEPGPYSCDYCSGSGISEVCDRCEELIELEDAYQL